MIDVASSDRVQIDEVAFPHLTSAELALVKPLATPCDYADGETVFRAGQADIDLYIIESGQMEIRNPTGGDSLIVTHGPGQFSGDIDLLTGRPVIVKAVARGATRVLRVPNSHLRTLLNRVPSLGEKLIAALTRRRELLSQMGTLGLRVVGPGHCRDTNTVREFLYKNFVPFTWFDTETEAGQDRLTALGLPQKTPVIECGDGRVLLNPSLQELANEAGIWRHCPSQEADFVIIGAGPAGIAAAVYASSEGLSTLVLDQLGPGGQAGASSRIENFIGFPAGLSGADLATRGVLQMLKFGARMVAPVNVEKITPARTVGELAHARVGLRRRDSLPGTAARPRRAVAKAGSRGSRAFCWLRRLLCLHNGGSRPLRRRRRQRCRRRQLGRTGRDVPGRVLSDANGPSADPSHAGIGHVRVSLSADPSRGQHRRSRTDRNRGR